MFNMTKNLTAYKRLMRIMLALAVLAFSTSFLVHHEIVQSVLIGLGLGLGAAVGFNLIVIAFKEKKGEEYVDDLNLQLVDERVKTNKLKVFAYSGFVSMFILGIVNIAHALYQFELLIGNIIVLLSYSISLSVFKLYFKNK